ncbi:peptidase M4 family protein [Pseudomonas sp. v388]|uniref:M4 family metallopeptidase n=1 Tax=Pseudomonas sp. v388 TaxID=2479849 RepID=UPI000F778F31|nr:M4 family metallopeptidase [Pseudomonas sp. v388]RRV05357.1 peptidase M4 family protein [Pseudomonas sp. v388]
MCSRNPLHCIIPPYILEHMALSGEGPLSARALANLTSSSAFVASRLTARVMPTMLAVQSPDGGKHRMVYDAQGTDNLPGTLKRSEGEQATGDAALDEAFDGSGDVYDFYLELFERNSLDDAGMSLVSTVHVAEVGFDGEAVPLNNAYWNGSQMAYGDGDDIVFKRFTGSLEVIGHELTHGVQAFSSNLEYQGQSGALNEHFADVFGILVRQWKDGTSAEQSSWLIGSELLVPAPTRRGIRDMEFPGTAYTDDPELGDDPQPAHMADLYTGAKDRGGVHINSGIPNRAFVLAAKALGGNAWDIAGRIWYETMLQLPADCQFVECARTSIKVAGDPRFGATAKKAVQAAWKKVGMTV